MDVTVSLGASGQAELMTAGVALLSALLGAGVGAYCSHLGTKASRRQIVVGGMKAIAAELEVNIASYNDEVAPHLREMEADDVFHFKWPVHGDYFPVYAANAALLGELKDEGLSREIITAVRNAKGMVDSIQFNALMVERYVDVRDGTAGLSVDGAAEVLEMREQLVEYAQRLREGDLRLREGVSALLPKIRALR